MPSDRVQVIICRLFVFFSLFFILSQKRVLTVFVLLFFSSNYKWHLASIYRIKYGKSSLYESHLKYIQKPIYGYQFSGSIDISSRSVCVNKLLVRQYYGENDFMFLFLSFGMWISQFVSIQKNVSDTFEF